MWQNHINIKNNKLKKITDKKLLFLQILRGVLKRFFSFKFNEIVIQYFCYCTCCLINYFLVFCVPCFMFTLRQLVCLASIYRKWFVIYKKDWPDLFSATAYSDFHCMVWPFCNLVTTQPLKFIKMCHLILVLSDTNSLTINALLLTFCRCVLKHHNLYVKLFRNYATSC